MTSLVRRGRRRGDRLRHRRRLRGCQRRRRRGAGPGAGEGRRRRRHQRRWPVATSTSAAAPPCSRRRATTTVPRRCTSTWSRCRREPDHEKIRAYCDGSVEHFNWLEDLGFQFERSYYPGKVVVPPGTEGLSYTGNEKVWPFCEQAKPAPRGHSVPVPGELGGAVDGHRPAGQARRRTGRADPLRDRRHQPGRRRRGRGRRALEALRRDRRGQGQVRHHRRGRLRDEPRDGRRAHPRARPATRAPSTTAWWRPTSSATPTTTASASGWASRRAASPRTWIRCSSPRPPTRRRSCSPAIIVNKDGKRFVAEDSYHSRTSAFVLEQPDQIGLPDRRRGPHADARDAADQVHRRVGDGRRDGSRAGDPGGNLAATLDRYNENAARRPGSRLPQAAGIRCAAGRKARGRRSTCRWVGRCTRVSPWAGWPCRSTARCWARTAA